MADPNTPDDQDSDDENQTPGDGGFDDGLHKNSDPPGGGQSVSMTATLGSAPAWGTTGVIHA